MSSAKVTLGATDANRGLRRASALAALLAVAAAVAVWRIPGDGSRSTVTVDAHSPTTASGPTEIGRVAHPARRAGAVVPERPAALRLPSGVSLRVAAVATKRDGRLAVPDDIRVAGWWRGGSKLGDPFGSTLIAAHIDSTSQGLGPYVELLSVRRDQVVTVSSAHLVQKFAVQSLRLLPRRSLSADSVIFSPRGPHRLTLVTCAPPYDASRGGYQNLVVVTAAPVTDPRSNTHR